MFFAWAVNTSDPDTTENLHNPSMIWKLGSGFLLLALQKKQTSGRKIQNTYRGNNSRFHAFILRKEKIWILSIEDLWFWVH
jgi:hypothetical protein